MTLVRGRSFADTDRASAPRVVIVNRTFAAQFFAGADPVGRRVGLCSAVPCAGTPGGMLEIVGLVEEWNDLGPRGDDWAPAVDPPSTTRIPPDEVFATDVAPLESAD